MSKKIDDLITIIIFLILLYVIYYIFTHSPNEYVELKDFYVAILGIIGSFTLAQWQVWRKISDLSLEIGKISGYYERNRNYRKSSRKRKK